MNCRECEPLLVEAARPRTFGTGGGAEVSAVLEHAASCPSCAERLAEERSLSLDLRRLADAESERAPSEGCEAILMAAYRTERGREVHTRRWIFALSGAMAASLVVLLGAALLLSSESTGLVRSMSSDFPSLSARNQGTAAGPSSVGSGEGSDELEAQNSSAQEEVTDFVAFYPGADVGSLELGALVRVRMPSSALGSFGLPVAQGSEEQWVTADLLVGEDGSPQAIRFVRPAQQQPSRD